MLSLRNLTVVSLLAAAAPGACFGDSSAPPKDAVIQYVAPYQLLVGVSYGMTAVDSQPLLLGQRGSTRVASGLRTVWYSCPNEPQMKGGSHLSFQFEAGRVYELACRAGQQAEIRPADC